jgi:hypothetical protein
MGFLSVLLQPLLNFFGGPVIKGAIDAYKAKLEAGNNADRIAADLAGRELDVQRREVEVQGEYKAALLGRWYEPVNLFGYILVFYIGKVMIWDAALGLGSTDAVRGVVGEWAGMIMIFYVGKRGLENIARIIKR